MWFNTRSNNSRIDINWPTAVWLIRCHVASYQRSWVLILSFPDFWAVRTSSGEQLQRPELRCLLPRQPDGGHRRPRVPRRIRERGRSQAEVAAGAFQGWHSLISLRIESWDLKSSSVLTIFQDRGPKNSPDCWEGWPNFPSPIDISRDTSGKIEYPSKLIDSSIPPTMFDFLSNEIPRDYGPGMWSRLWLVGAQMHM